MLQPLPSAHAFALQSAAVDVAASGSKLQGRHFGVNLKGITYLHMPHTVRTKFHVKVRYVVRTSMSAGKHDMLPQT